MAESATQIGKLAAVTRSLLDATRPPFTLRAEVLALKAIFETCSRRFDDSANDISTGETRTKFGVAISPTMASMCVDDFARTIQFLRGTNAAVEDLRERVGRRPVEILYAGCGPWAPLAVPLMSKYSANEVRFTLLDIHEQSIQSVGSLIECLGFDDRVAKLETADASNYLIDSPPDLIVVEMLRPTLKSEPQVAVTGHLRKQAPNAVMIPKLVCVDLALVNSSRELSVSEAEPSRDRIVLRRVFELDTKTLPATDDHPVRVTLPEFDASRYCPMLLTTVEVFQGLRLADYDSGITLPMKLPGIGPKDTAEFTYEVCGDPHLAIRKLP